MSDVVELLFVPDCNIKINLFTILLGEIHIVYLQILWQFIAVAPFDVVIFMSGSGSLI